MKKYFFSLILLILVTFTEGATIYITVHNVNEEVVEGAYVKLYSSDWSSVIRSGYTDKSGDISFALLDYGVYNYEVYYTWNDKEFWGSEENIDLQKPELKSEFTRYWPYRYDYSLPPSSVNTGRQSSFEITVKNRVSINREVKIELWVDRDQSRSWDFHELSESQSIGSGRTNTYTFNYTATSEGVYFWKMNVLAYNDGAEDFIVTDSYSWEEVFSANKSLGALEIKVKNIGGDNVGNAYVKLYDKNWDIISDGYTNELGGILFNNLEYGQYNYEVFNSGDVREFWGWDESININGPSKSETFTRNWPYHSNHKVSDSNFDVGSQATFEITVKNELSFQRNVKVELWVDKDKEAPSGNWDFHEISDQVSIDGNGFKTFFFNFTPISSGRYSWKMHVLSYNDGAGDFLVTDSRSWKNSFEVINNFPFPLKEGAIVYHSYTNYDRAWDSRLFMYDFSKKERIELGENWIIDHEMNAHISPDGSKIVFMGDYAADDSRDWDIYLWDIGSGDQPKNLTSPNGLNGLRDEDPKFSPDGKEILFKQNKDLAVMDLEGNILYKLTDDDDQNEDSMPYFTLDGESIIYAIGVKEHSDLYTINKDGSNKRVLFNESLIQEYYPIAINKDEFYLTSWISPYEPQHQNYPDYPFDQIYVGDLTGNKTWLSVNDANSSNSDAFPVDSDHLFFSSTRDGRDYNLFFGQISSGEIWRLDDFEINSSNEELGVSYTPIIRNIHISAISNPKNGGTITGMGSYYLGESVYLEATPETGYSFVGWFENGVQVSSEQNYDFSTTENRNLVANFVERPKMKLSGDIVFGDVALGLSKEEKLNISNSGAVDINTITILSPEGFYSNPESISNLEVDKSMDVTVTFSPTESKSYTGQVIVSYDGGEERINISGEGSIITSLDPSAISKALIIYPNPSINEIIIDWTLIDTYHPQFKLFSSEGKTVLSLKGLFQKKEIVDISTLAEGIYTVSFTGRFGIINKKVVIRR